MSVFGVPKQDHDLGKPNILYAFHGDATKALIGERLSLRGLDAKRACANIGLAGSPSKLWDVFSKSHHTKTVNTPHTRRTCFVYAVGIISAHGV